MKLFVNPKPGSELKVPGLVWEAPTTALTESGHWEMTAAGGAMARPRAGEPLIFLLEKAPGTNNPFAMGVTVGRVGSNDLIIDDASVSRFHAWFQQDERSQQWALTDAESKNGTWVDGAKAAAKTRLVLRDGALLKFGEVTVTFLLPAALTTFVEQRFRAA